jgi:hypothetical protein
MIYVGIDDTDTADTRGTNQLAKFIVRSLAPDYRCVWIVRHQLLFDRRIPYTSKNGSASIVLEGPDDSNNLQPLADRIEAIMRGDFIEGSDPGLCFATGHLPALIEFGHRCQREIVPQNDAQTLATQQNLLLRGLGGTEDGIIGALAAVGLAMQGNDGRVVQLGESADDLSGRQSVETLQTLGVSVRCHADNQPITTGFVDVGKKLRPNLRDRRFVLFVEPNTTETALNTPWIALKLH